MQAHVQAHMQAHTPLHPRWSTASFGDDAQTSPMELSALGSHLHTCRSATGRLFAARCVADTLHGFVASRMVTTVAVVGVLAALGCLML